MLMRLHPMLMFGTLFGALMYSMGKHFVFCGKTLCFPWENTFALLLLKRIAMLTCIRTGSLSEPRPVTYYWSFSLVVFQ